MCLPQGTPSSTLYLQQADWRVWLASAVGLPLAVQPDHQPMTALATGGRAVSRTARTGRATKAMGLATITRAARVAVLAWSCRLLICLQVAAAGAETARLGETPTAVATVLVL
jgi:hypothetical protein